MAEESNAVERLCLFVASRNTAQPVDVESLVGDLQPEGSSFFRTFDHVGLSRFLFPNASQMECKTQHRC
jgi:hypothetical protein